MYKTTYKAFMLSHAELDGMEQYFDEGESLVAIVPSGYQENRATVVLQKRTLIPTMAIDEPVDGENWNA